MSPPCPTRAASLRPCVPLDPWGCQARARRPLPAPYMTPPLEGAPPEGRPTQPGLTSWSHCPEVCRLRNFSAALGLSSSCGGPCHKPCCPTQTPGAHFCSAAPLTTSSPRCYSDIKYVFNVLMQTLMNQPEGGARSSVTSPLAGLIKESWLRLVPGLPDCHTARVSVLVTGTL